VSFLGGDSFGFII